MAQPPPVPTLSRYELYKAGTTKLVSWLLSTAASCGYGDPKAATRGTVAVSKLQRCAEAISKRTPAIYIPGRMVELAEEVIQGRELYAGLHAGTSSKSTGKDGHQHFIDVLRHVHEVLKDTRKRFKANRSTPKKVRRIATVEDDPEEEQSMPNGFDGLTIHEPSVEPFSPLRKTQEEEAEPASVSVKLNPDEEKEFAVWCWLGDMLEVREYVRGIWESYAFGELSLDCATATTEAAFTCMRCSEMDLYNTWNKLGYPAAELQDVFIKLVNDSRDAFRQAAAPGSLDSVPDSVFDAVLLTCPGAMEIVQVYYEEVARFGEARRSKIPFEISQENVVAANRDAFTKALFDLIPHLYRVNYGLDEFTTLVCTWNGQSKMPLCLIMAVQSYQDIYDIIGDPSSLVVLEDLDVTSRYLEAMRRYKTSCLLNPSAVRMVQEDERLQAKIEREHERATRRSPGYKGKQSKMQLSENAIYRAFPVGAGEELKWLKWTLTMSGARQANHGAAIVGLAYLYRAAQHYGMIETVWEDLEWLLRLQSRQRPLIMEVATHAADEFAFVKHFTMTNGLTASGKMSLSSLRMIESQLEYAGMLMDRFDSMESITMRKDRRQFVLQQIAQKQDRKDGSHCFTSLQLVQAFQKSFVQDEEEANFSYIGFATSCIGLIHEIHEGMIKLLPSQYSQYLNHQVGDVQVVVAMLAEAASAKSLGIDMNLTTIAIAARLLEKHIKKEGHKYIRDSRARCSGTLADDRKPTFQFFPQVDDEEDPAPEQGTMSAEDEGTVGETEAMGGGASLESMD